MYQVDVQRKAEKQIDRLPPEIRRRVLVSLRDLKNNPRPGDVVKMRGFDRRYRIRIGNYRVIYDIYDDRLLVVVVEVGHRREVYR